MPFRILSGLLVLCFYISFSQSKDSIHYQLPEVQVQASSPVSRMRLLNAEGNLDKNSLQGHVPFSTVNAVNTISGVRMEERSPGSYRLSIRGSLLRSPFGIRNVKIYLGEFAFTDAGGNAYLNGLDLSYINSIRILKGPEGSIFGANTGGVMLLDPVYKTADSLAIKAFVTTGSFGLFQSSALVQRRWAKNLLTVNYGFHKSDGYRRNSALQRHYFQIANTWNYNQRSSLKFLFLVSDLHYQTPGGLTLEQFNSNPQSARPATKATKGAEEQKAGIFSKTIFGGISHDRNFTKSLRHVVSVFGSYTDFQNPFITNYETRKETTLGGRTYFELKVYDRENFKLRANIGGEYQHTGSVIYNYGNRAGNKDTVQAADELRATQSFAFARFMVDIGKKVLFEASASYNFYQYRFKNILPFDDASFNQNNFKPRLMPKLAASYLPFSNLAFRASVSEGYSPPTIAEIRSSDNRVNTSLSAETGLNYEAGIRARDNQDIIVFDACLFYYSLRDAIVRRVNENGTDYFINAGGTSQPGFETEIKINPVKREGAAFLNLIKITGSFTFYDFSFKDYKSGKSDYTGNRITGVPEYTTSQTLTIGFWRNIKLHVMHYYASSIPVNDANSVLAREYSLVQLKADVPFVIKKQQLNFFSGCDNLLNEKYSLGNDLNAAGERYYNPAPARNFYVGLKLGI